MGFYGFRPYVPVAQRRWQAQKEMAKLSKNGRVVSPIAIEGRKIAQSFWGKAWCDNLERYSDFENRLPRGRTYVRNGSVIDLQIERGKVEALVSGSEIYKVKVEVAVAAPARWKAICRDCAGSIGSLIELLQGKLSKNVMERVCREADGLFPAPPEIKMSCSCPDWADMCKHVAATLYGVGTRLDSDPDLLFALRGVDRMELVSTVGADLPLTEAAAASERVLAEDDVGALFGLDLAAPRRRPTGWQVPRRRNRVAAQGKPPRRLLPPTRGSLIRPQGSPQSCGPPRPRRRSRSVRQNRRPRRRPPPSRPPERRRRLRPRRASPRTPPCPPAGSPRRSRTPWKQSLPPAAPRRGPPLGPAKRAGERLDRPSRPLRGAQGHGLLETRPSVETPPLPRLLAPVPARLRRAVEDMRRDAALLQQLAELHPQKSAHRGRRWRRGSVSGSLFSQHYAYRQQRGSGRRRVLRRMDRRRMGLDPRRQSDGGHLGNRNFRSLDRKAWRGRTHRVHSVDRGTDLLRRHSSVRRIQIWRCCAFGRPARRTRSAGDRRVCAVGARVLGEGEPKIGAHGKPVLFLHPKDIVGTLVEIEQV